ncbi:MAG: metalloregulator ArsR/SmtB family transcription factor [Eubacteriales bacterium]|nr:metalloregulator ArsR/SmtB family transcription factor [Eubacteriales bacterium]MDD4421759.1 metalloregulator ArsR/SmtB family transcription factor [Eubacteriales bacterium]HBR31417.1 transcriptional regulator [Clostridiales bacterium]
MHITDKDNVECFLYADDAMISRVRKNLPQEDVLYNLAELFKIFGDSTRIKILCVLLEGEMCVGDIALLLGISQSAISHQLNSLKKSKLITYRRDGKAMLYSLADDHVKDIINEGIDHVLE